MNISIQTRWDSNQLGFSEGGNVSLREMNTETKDRPGGLKASSPEFLSQAAYIGQAKGRTKSNTAS